MERPPGTSPSCVTLRFLLQAGRLSEPELLEPLVPSVLTNLEHKHHFIRRHAVSAVSAIYRLSHGDQLIPDAPCPRLLVSEQDASARRNAFLMLCACAQEHAVTYLLSNVDRVYEWPDLLHMAVLNPIHKNLKNQESAVSRSAPSPAALGPAAACSPRRHRLWQELKKTMRCRCVSCS